MIARSNPNRANYRITKYTLSDFFNGLGATATGLQYLSLPADRLDYRRLNLGDRREVESVGAIVHVGGANQRFETLGDSAISPRLFKAVCAAVDREHQPGHVAIITAIDRRSEARVGFLFEAFNPEELELIDAGMQHLPTEFVGAGRPASA